MKKTTFFALLLVFAFISHSQTQIWSDNFDDLNISDCTLVDYDSDGSN